MTSSPSSSARALTGDGVRMRLRPTGASGRVRTARTVCSESTRASRAGTATSGVPAKTISTEVDSTPCPAPHSDRGSSMRTRTCGSFFAERAAVISASRAPTAGPAAMG
ncbi:Uncharacterised protein [Mycobacteroides abscessus subsp. abscessus]|nr:Uncharacterised protein [Mycobacteroides abscessus subsp. abscessus]